MRWRELVSRKASQVRITTKAWPSELGEELASMEDLAAAAEVAAAIVKMKGSFHECD